MHASKLVLFLNYFFLSLPLIVIILHLAAPSLFAGLKKKIFWGIAVPLLAWAVICLEMVIDPPETQFTLICAGWFGWLYIWFLLTPALIIYAALRWGILSLIGLLGKNRA